MLFALAHSPTPAGVCEKHRRKLLLVSFVLWCNTYPPSSCLPSPPSISLSGVVCLSQALCSTDEYSSSLLHLDLSRNPGVLSGEDASVRKRPKSQSLPVFSTVFPTQNFSLAVSLQNLYLFLSQPNCLVHLDLSGTDCSVDSVSVNTGTKEASACSCRKAFSDSVHPVSHAAVWGSPEGVLCRSLLSQPFKEFLLSQVSRL